MFMKSSLYGISLVLLMLCSCGTDPERENPVDALPIDAAKEKIEEAKEKIKKEMKALEDAIKELDESFEEKEKEK